MSEQLLKQLGIEQQILQQMVDERAALAEAERLGITVSDEEVRQRIFAIPAFQENGAFIGEQRYQQLLRHAAAAADARRVRGQRPPQPRRSKSCAPSLTDWLSVPDKELEQEYRRRNDKVKLAVVSFTADSFRAQVTATDAEVAELLRRAQGRLQDSREAQDPVPARSTSTRIRAKVVVPPADIERAYNNNIEQYSTPEQVRASHILLKTEGKDDAAVKAKAEDVLKQAKAGADFARAGEEEFRRRGEREERRRPRLLRPRPHGAGVRSGGVRDAARPDQRSGQDAVRLPHHQAGRQEGRRPRGRSPRCGSS